MLSFKKVDNVGCASSTDNVDENPTSSKELQGDGEIAKLLDNGKLLIQAVKLGNEDLVKEMLNAGVPCYITDQLGCNPFFYAARYNHINILKILLKAGALVNVVTKMGRSALQIAAYHGHIDCVEFLLNNKANVNLVDSLKMSALHWASENGHLETVKLLLKRGSNASLVSKFEETALTLAIRKKHYEIYELLRMHLNNGAKSSAEYILAENLAINGHKTPCKSFSALINSEGSTVTSSEQKITSQNRKWNDNLKSKLDCMSFEKNDTIKLFEQHGIKLLPVDQSTIIASALKRGQTAVLTEAGKLALKKTEPNIIRKIASMPNNNTQSSQQPPPKKLKPDEESKDNAAKGTVVKNNNADISLNKAKIIKIDAKQLVNLAANKKLIISRPKRIAPSSINELVNQTENVNPNPVEKERSDSANINLSTQLKKKSILIKDLRNQLELSIQLAKHYKSKYEVKEREAALYKTQLTNLSKMIIKSGIAIPETKA